MKKLLLIIFCLLALALHVFADNWIQVSSNKYVNTESAIRYNTNLPNTLRYSFWGKSFNDNSKTFNDVEDRLKQKTNLVDIQMIIDCNNKTYMPKRYILYDGNSKVIEDFTAEDYQVTWKQFGEYSPMQKVYELICKP